jgi:hypothetical protein
MCHFPPVRGVLGAAVTPAQRHSGQGRSGQGVLGSQWDEFGSSQLWWDPTGHTSPKEIRCLAALAMAPSDTKPWMLSMVHFGIYSHAVVLRMDRVKGLDGFPLSGPLAVGSLDQRSAIFPFVKEPVLLTRCLSSFVYFLLVAICRKTLC